MPVQGEPKKKPAHRQADKIEPFDPATVEPNTTDPQPSSPAPAEQPESQPGPDEEANGSERPLPEFDPRHRDSFQGLIYIGALKDTFTWLGHEFVIRTLTTGELTEIALAAKPYAGSGGEMKAYQAGVVAGCVMSVDDKPLPIPLTDDQQRDSAFLNRFNYVMRHWFPPTLDAVYEKYVDLELTVRDVIGAMGNHSG